MHTLQFAGLYDSVLLDTKLVSADRYAIRQFLIRNL